MTGSRYPIYLMHKSCHGLTHCSTLRPGDAVLKLSYLPGRRPTVIKQAVGDLGSAALHWTSVLRVYEPSVHILRVCTRRNFLLGRNCACATSRPFFRPSLSHSFISLILSTTQHTFRFAYHTDISITEVSVLRQAVTAVNDGLVFLPQLEFFGLG